MPRAVDRLPLPISNDPNQSLEYHIRYGLQQGLDMWMVILDAIREHAEALVKEVIEKIVGFALDPQGTIEDALGELLAWAVNVPGLQQLVLALTGAAGGLTELEEWASNLWQQVLTAINTHAGINLSSWNAFLASLDDGKGIDLPGLAGALQGIDLSSPGGVLAAIAGVLLGGLVSVGSLTDAPVNAVAAGTFPAGSMPDAQDWTLSDSITDDGTFSAQVIADGQRHAFRSGKTPADTFAVTPGQTVDLSIDVRHQSVSCSGPVILFQAVPYTDGVAGAPVTIVGYTPAAGTDTQSLSGSWTVPEGVTGAQTRVLLTEAAISGTFWVDNVFVDRRPLIKQGWVEALPEALQQATGRWQLLVDTLTGGLSGGGLISEATLGQLGELLLAIPFQNVTGVGGPSTVGASILGFLNQLLGGFTAEPNLDAGLSDAYNIGNQIGQWATLGAFSWDVLGIRDNRPLFTGFLPSGKSNFNLTDVAFEGSAPLIDVTQSASVIAVDRIEESSPLGVISWIGQDLADITAFYVNIWRIDADGAFNLVHHSPNILGDLDNSGVPAWNFYDMEDPIDTVAGEEYAFELVVVGSGSHKVVGKQTWLPNHPRAQVVAFAATRNNTVTPDAPPVKISKGSVTRSVFVPWVETAISSGVGSDVHTPTLVYVTKSGTTPIPSWAHFIDAVVLGGAGGGGGEGGSAGGWAAVTWRRGVDFTDADGVVVFGCGVGGPGGPVGAGGSGGGASTFTVGTTNISAAGGGGGDVLALLDRAGRSPGSFSFAGQTLKGGGPQAVLAADGSRPGGGGAGRNPVTAIMQPGGHGADGAGWLRFRQAPIDGEAPLDVAVPAAPTLEVVSVTHSSVTVQATKATGDPVTVVGYHFYMGGVRRTATVSYDDTFTFTGLPSGMTTDDLTATSVGTYANESSPSTAVTGTTIAYVPGSEDALSVPDQSLVDGVMGNIVTSGRAWGASIAVTGPTGAYEKAYGRSGPEELSDTRDLTIDDHFRIGSTTKMFVAYAVLMELDKGSLALTDLVSDHIPPDYFGRRIPNDEAITVEHLLTMRSGLAEYLGNLFLGIKLLMAPTMGYTETEHLDWIRVWGGNDYGQAPFGEFTYCNSNYIVLGEIVKNCSGKTIKQYIREDILFPLGMTETSWPDTADMPAPFANGKWDSANTNYKVWTNMHPDWGAASGAMVSTQHDLQKWGREILDGTLLSEGAHDMALNRVYNTAGAGGITTDVITGYGFANLSVGGWRGHGGSIPGYDTVCMVHPGLDAVVTAMQCYQSSAPPFLYYNDLAEGILPALYPGSMDRITWPDWTP